MKSTLSKMIVLSALILSMGAISACNTVNGVGKDVSATGHAISRSS